MDISVEPSSVIILSIVIILLYISHIVSELETSITAVSLIRLKTLEDTLCNDEKEKSKYLKIKYLIDIKDKQDEVISTMLILNNAVNIVVTALTTSVVKDLFGNRAVTIATFMLTMIVLVFCEVLPKKIATIRAEKCLLKYIGLLKIAIPLCTPIRIIIDAVVNFIASIFKIDLDKKEETLTEEEFKTIVDISREEGIIESDEKKFIDNVVESKDRVLEDIMTKKENIVYVNKDDTLDTILEIFREHAYTRYPIIDGNIDNIIGVLNVKDILFLNDTMQESFDLDEFIREPFFLDKNKTITNALKRMRVNNVSIVFVRDVNCKTVGLATIEDIVEEIVGEIRDEYDEEDE